MSEQNENVIEMPQGETVASSYSITAPQQKYLQKLFQPVLTLGQELNKARAAFEDAVSYVKEELGVPADYIFSPDGTKFVEPPKTPAPAEG